MLFFLPGALYLRACTILNPPRPCALPHRRLKMPKLSLEEVITGCICVAIGGLFISFVI